MACRLINFWNMLNQDGLLCCELLNSLMVLNNTYSLMYLQNSLSFYIIKYTKRLAIKSNIKIFWLEFTMGLTVNPYITLRMCVTNFDNNGKISKVRGICWVGCKRVTRCIKELPALNVVANYMIENLFLKIVKVLLIYFSQNVNQKF